MNYLLSLFLLLALPSFAQPDTLILYYDVDAWKLSEAQRVELQRLQQNSEFVLLDVRAYCDSSASHAYNEALAQRRLQEVRKTLGVHARTIEGTSFGERKANTTKKGSDFDRRVELVYLTETPMPIVIEEVVEEVPEEQLPQQSLVEQFLENENQEEVIIQLTILFYNVSGVYLPESEPELFALYDFMRDHPTITVHIRGHICCNPYSEWDEISQARAATVAFFLVDRGIDRDRITYKGYGTSIPFRSPEITDEDRKLNRRVDVVFTKHQE